MRWPSTNQAHPGWTEEIIGDWFASGGGRAERTVLATKLYGAMGDWPNEGRLSALNIRRACDASLRRLRTDYIDLYQMHHIDRDTPWDEIWQAMEVLVAQGKILYVGSSNFAGWHITQANDTAAARGFFGLVSEQSIYNLLTREIELEVLPAAIDYGVGVIPWSPLEGGLLGGVLKKEREGRRRQAGPPTPCSGTVSRSRPTRPCAMSSASSRLTWRWPGCCTRKASPGRSSGRRTEDQLDDAQHAITVHLGEDVLKRLDDLFPGYQPRAGALRLVRLPA